VFWSSGIERIKTMNPSVFERLATNFSECHKKIGQGNVPSDWGIQDVMKAAGRALFTAMSSGKIDLGDIPQWLKTDPIIEMIEDDLITGKRDAQVVVYENRDLYWLAAIKWLALNRPGSGLVRPRQIWAVKPEEHFASATPVLGLFMERFGVGERLPKALHSFTTLSEDACQYLAQLQASKPETAKTEPENKPDNACLQEHFSCIIEIDASRFNSGKTWSLLTEIINDAKRKGVKCDKKRTWRSLKDRLKKAAKKHDKPQYSTLAESLKYKNGLASTNIPFGKITILSKS